VEGAVEGDDPIALRPAARGLIFPHGLDGALDRLGAGILKERDVGEGRVAQPLRDPLGLRNFVEVGDVPDLVGLLGQRGDEMRMVMAERGDGDARAKVEIALAGGRGEPCAFAPLEGEVDARIGRHQMRGHGPLSRCAAISARLKRNVPPLRGGTMSILFRRARPVNIGKACAAGAFSLSSSTHGQEYVDARSTSLARDSRHIVAFSSSSTTSRAADSLLKRSGVAFACWAALSRCLASGGIPTRAALRAFGGG